MQKLLALPRGAGDYVHPDEEVQIIDEGSGTTYNLIVKSGGGPKARGSIFLHIPASTVADVKVLGSYCVIELSMPADETAGKNRAQGLLRMVKP